MVPYGVTRLYNSYLEIPGRTIRPLPTIVTRFYLLVEHFYFFFCSLLDQVHILFYIRVDRSHHWRPGLGIIMGKEKSWGAFCMHFTRCA
ncbi:hypothetical protein BDV25DRAFT_101495 [Aspergillus avenaceus]|uniref:Uncharacterized protein n=1 Tax=Aspergillus avenaceus TaxID=36643 RepID=A0A5N6TY37_ASPAV|nr:hypothetical protein BDV25DRAFT_101495 [Aspergillus avenaceus]